MSSYLSVWVSFGFLSQLLLAAGAAECSEEEAPLVPKPTSMKLPTYCLRECSTWTYHKKLQLQDKHNIRITDSKEGDPGEYCWSTKVPCLIGESFTKAYVVLPVDVSAAGNEQVEVRTTGPTATTLHTNTSPTTISERCGLIYEVTPHFTPTSTETSFCVQVVAQAIELGERFLTCPPFLVTFWQRSPNQHDQQDLG